MTASEMQEEFFILYDKITNLSAPGYLPDEVSRFLTKAQERIVLRIINPRGNKYLSGVESTEKRRKDLSELTESVSLLPANQSTDQQGVMTNGIFYDLPTNFLWAIQEEVVVESADDCINGSTLEVKPITHDQYNKAIRNPFKKPSEYIAWRMDYSGTVNGALPKRHELILAPTLIPSNYRIRYIKRPRPIITAAITVDGVLGPLDSELDAITHRAIIDEAVAIATGITSPELYTIKVNETKISE